MIVVNLIFIKVESQVIPVQVNKSKEAFVSQKKSICYADRYF